MAVALSVGSAQAQDMPEASPEQPSFVIKTFPIGGGDDLPRTALDQGTINLIGEPDSKSFGVSFTGTLAPQALVTGNEKLFAYLYLDCDGRKPDARVAVGTVELGALKQGRGDTTVFATADVTAFAPLANVNCASLAIRTDEPDKAPYVVKTFTEKEIIVADDVMVVNATVSLIGEPESKSFGVSYRGTLTPAIEMTGEETLVVHLYMKCDNKPPSETSAITVGTATIGEVRKGRDPSFRIVTGDVSAFVPLKDVECAKLRLQ